jgi:hypothetical protein
MSLNSGQFWGAEDKRQADKRAISGQWDYSAPLRADTHKDLERKLKACLALAEELEDETRYEAMESPTMIAGLIRAAVRS